MINGSVTLNGLTDKQYLKTIEFKIAHEGQFTYNPTNAEMSQPDASKPPVYNKLSMAWSNDVQMKTVLELLAALHGA